MKIINDPEGENVGKGTSDAGAVEYPVCSEARVRHLSPSPPGVRARIPDELRICGWDDFKLELDVLDATQRGSSKTLRSTSCPG